MIRTSFHFRDIWIQTRHFDDTPESKDQHVRFRAQTAWQPETQDALRLRLFIGFTSTNLRLFMMTVPFSCVLMVPSRLPWSISLSLRILIKSWIMHQLVFDNSLRPRRQRQSRCPYPSRDAALRMSSPCLCAVQMLTIGLESELDLEHLVMVRVALHGLLHAVFLSTLEICDNSAIIMEICDNICCCCCPESM